MCILAILLLVSINKLEVDISVAIVYCKGLNGLYQGSTAKGTWGANYRVLYY